MEQLASTARLIRFGVFELDLRTGELRKSGLKLRLHGQPVEILKLLLERPGELVTREELEKRLWVGDTVVEFEHSINAAVNRLREALGDSADNPRFIETLARRGYRFIYPVAASSPATDVGAPAETVQGAGAGETPHRGVSTSVADVGARHGVPLQKRWAVAAIASGLAIVAALFALNVAGLRDRVVTAVGARHGVPLRKIESIAVLPLENLSGDPDQEYFADGMTEALITDLGKISALRVISRTSVMRYKGTKKSIPEIARELNVNAVMEGSVMRSGDRVRITAQLIQAIPEKHLWSESFERDLRDVLALQGEVAQAIAHEVKAKLTPQEQARLTRTRPINPQAYREYLEGRVHSWRHSTEGSELAIQHFQRAVEIDPKFVLGYVGLARTLITPWGPPRVKERIRHAREAALKALELDPTSGEAHAALAQIRCVVDWDWKGAEAEFQLAIELSPGFADAHHDYSHFLVGMGRFEESLRESKRALALDPLSVRMRMHLGGHHLWAGQPDLAIAQFREVPEGDPSYADARRFLAISYEQKEMFDDAVSEYLKQKALEGTSPKDLTLLREGYRAGGMKGFWKRELETALRKNSPNAHYVAIIYSALGNRDQAIAWLEKSFKVRPDDAAHLRDPRFDPLRSDPRFQDLLRRMNFPP
jgi:TolB-like protein/DNA-binding winged helix-turn-helix (wHTH) protein/Flp pilus assembly protein TadD